MKESTLSFANPEIYSAQMMQAPNFDSEKEDETFESLVLSVDIQRHPERNAAVVAVNLNNKKTFTDNDANKEAFPNVRFLLDLDIAAVFSWSEDTSEEMISSLLNQNAVALLISYLRPYLANMTSTSNEGSYNLPFIDLT